MSRLVATIAALVIVSGFAGTGLYLWQAKARPVGGGDTPCNLALAERVDGVMSTAVMDTLEACVASGELTARAVQIAVGNR
jgi:hypothetical protein